MKFLTVVLFLAGTIMFDHTDAKVREVFQDVPEDTSLSASRRHGCY